MAAAQVPRAPVPALSRRSARRPTRRRTRGWGLRPALLLVLLALAACGRVERSWPAGAPRFEGALDLDGERHGEWTFHYPDGSLRERGRYDHGRRVGVWRQWHNEGRLASEGERAWNEATRASEREGPWVFHDAAGTLRARGAFRAGRRTGPWEFFDADGRKTEEPPWARDASASGD